MLRKCPFLDLVWFNWILPIKGPGINLGVQSKESLCPSCKPINKTWKLETWKLAVQNNTRQYNFTAWFLLLFFFPQLRERTAVYLLKILPHPGLTQEQKTTCEKFKTMMLSLNLQSMRLNAGDSKITNDEEVSTINSVHHLTSGYFVNLKVGSVCFCFSASESGPLSRRKNCCFWIIFPITE